MTEFRETKTTVTKDGITIIRNTYRKRRPDHFWGKEYHKYQAKKGLVDTIKSYHTKKGAIKALNSLTKTTTL